jgi:hypothetical protein
MRWDIIATYRKVEKCAYAMDEMKINNYLYDRTSCKNSRL